MPLTPEAAHELIRQGEGQKVEFKAQTPDASSLARLIVAFANAQGGTIFVGVTDRGEIVGADIDETSRVFYAALSALHRPPKVDLEAVALDGRQVATITVSKGDRLAASKDGAFRRVGDHVVVMPATAPSQPTKQAKAIERASIGARKHVVLLIHGIRTQGEWQQRAAVTLETEPTIRVRPTRYEFLDVVRFLLPFASLRRRPIRRITSLIRDELTKKPAHLSIVAHSFGTFIIGQILENETDIEIHRLILCGSIIPDSFPWERFRHRLAPGDDIDWQVVNDCGLKDPWPVLAQWVSGSYGSSGRFGFGHGRVKDRFHPVDHSGFFSEDFVRTYWLPYLKAGEIGEGQLDRPTTPWWFSLLTVLRLRYLIVCCVALLLLAGINRLSPGFNVAVSGLIGGSARQTSPAPTSLSNSSTPVSAGDNSPTPTTPAPPSGLFATHRALGGEWYEATFHARIKFSPDGSVSGTYYQYHFRGRWQPISSDTLWFNFSFTDPLATASIQWQPGMRARVDGDTLELIWPDQKRKDFAVRTQEPR